MTQNAVSPIEAIRQERRPPAVRVSSASVRQPPRSPATVCPWPLTLSASVLTRTSHLIFARNHGPYNHGGLERRPALQYNKPNLEGGSMSKTKTRFCSCCLPRDWVYCIAMRDAAQGRRGYRVRGYAQR